MAPRLIGRTLLRGAALMALAMGTTIVLTGPATAEPVEQAFAEVGAHDFVVPENVCEVTVEAFGAEGGDGEGNNDSPSLPGGAGALGGRALHTFAVTPGEVLQVNVGGAGGSGGSSADPNGGANGGGNGGADDANSTGGGGGGASDVRQGGTGLDHRVVVAAGGGGGGGQVTFGDDFLAGAGGAGGGAVGTDGADSPYIDANSEGGKGGSQTAGGAGGVGFASDGFAGSLGLGGVGGEASGAGGGGGGGYYGGGGGAPGTNGGGGGGGSGLGAVLESGVRAGDGLVVLRYEPQATPCGVPVLPVRFTG